MRVLIVEDENSLRTAIAGALTRRGHDVVAVADAESALGVYKEKAFPLVVLDWLLPGMTGVDLCRIIRMLPNGDQTFVLLATARTSRADVESSLAAGVDDYIAKPLDMGLLETRLIIAEQVIAHRQKRREAEDRFALVFRQSPDAIALVRQRDHHVLDANDNFVGIFGDGAVLLGKLDLRPGVKIDAETVTITRPGTGTLVHALASVSSVVVGGEPCWLIMCHDVTERERLRSQLMLADKMASVGTLAAGVAHEINNPLAYVMANLGFVADEIKRLNPDEDVTQAIDEAIHGAERVKSIVRDLKSFSRDDQEQTGPVNVNDVLDSAVNLAWNEIRHRARLLKSYGEVPSVTGNKGRLGQVFVNLLINAAQAIAEGDATHNSIELTTRALPNGRVAIEVTDSGPGIRPEHMRRIFDPFFTTKPVGVGTGLGLSICHAIVTSFGGTITVESEPGRGATFTVTLPASTAALDRAGAQSGTTSGRRGRLLLVDDEALIGKSLLRVLSSEHNVDVVTSGSEALERLKHGREYDVVLCDLMMPEMSGMDLHAQISEQYPEMVKKMVFVTGGAFTPRAREFVERGELLVLDKPLDLQVLRQAIRDRMR